MRHISVIFSLRKLVFWGRGAGAGGKCAADSEARTAESAEGANSAKSARRRGACRGSSGGGTARATEAAHLQQRWLRLELRVVRSDEDLIGVRSAGRVLGWGKGVSWGEGEARWGGDGVGARARAWPRALGARRGEHLVLCNVAGIEGAQQMRLKLEGGGRGV